MTIPSNTKFSNLPLAVSTNTVTDYVPFARYDSILMTYTDYRMSVANLIGPTGAAGPANSLAIGTTTTLPPGSAATASITGAPPSQTLSLGIPAGAPGIGNVTTTGTVTNGAPVVFSGTAGMVTSATLPWTVPQGGTGIASYTIGDILYASASTTLSRLADIATGNALLSGGVGVAPAWGKVDVTTTITGIVPAPNGGTGQGTYAIGDILFASTTSALSRLADVATGNALISGGANIAPSWGKIGLTTHVSGTLPVGSGGTGTTSLTLALDTFSSTQGAVLYRDAAAWQALAPGTAGNVLTTGGAAANPSWAAAASGSGFPSAFLTKSANYTVLTTDKNTLFTCTGTFTLSLPSGATMGAGNGIYLSKTDGSGRITITPASGTIDGRSSIFMYQERFALVSDGTNWVSVNRPKGWIDIQTVVQSSAVASLAMSLGFDDTELLHMQYEGSVVVLSANDILLARVQKGAGFLATNYVGAVIGAVGATVSSVNDTTAYSFATGAANTFNQSVGITLLQFAANNSKSTATMWSVSNTLSNASNGGGTQNDTGAITGFEFIPKTGSTNISSGTFYQRAWRP